ncbi:replicative DNA helicase [Aquibacillus saliphilus]|uniref:replicative DNA helicase n=1 Tax=Aquibacillus saliphilus TaxID=1909422 RepID=UPI001CF01100|nr:replicative DNA helicase [Aquibacillus saliphilus]
MTDKVLEDDKLKDEVYPSESFLTALFWKHPEFYLYYPADKVSERSFGNKVWGFFFQLGRYAHQRKLQNFDEIAISQVVKEYGLEKKFEQYGEFDFISENMDYVKDKKDNFEKYYEEVKKYNLLRSLRDVFGDKVSQNTEKYNYKKMNRFQVQTYWQDIVNEIAITNDVPIKEYDLFDPDEMREMVNELDIESDFGMPMYNSDKLNEIMQGWGDNTLTILSGFSGNGKSSFSVHSLIIGCLVNKEKLLIMGNEMGVRAYRKLALITIMGSKDLYEKTNGLKGFDRKNINKGDFTDEEKARLHAAITWIEENLEGDNALVKFVPLDDYTIDHVEMVMRHYAHRNYRKMILDTAKPTEGGGNLPRWQRFTEDFERIGSLMEKDTGLDVSLFATVQAADEAIRMRYLDERCLGDSKKIKNVADTVLHMRPVRTDELEGGKKAIEVYDFFPKDMPKDRIERLQKQGWVNDPEFKSDNKPYWKLRRKLDKESVYYLIFTSKNRRNESNLTGLDVLVLKVNFNSNKWDEIGWTKDVERDTNY